MSVKVYFRKYLAFPRVETDGRSSDDVDKPPNSYNVTLTDIVFLVYSILFHVLHIVFNVILAWHYFKDEKQLYFGLTLCFMLVPSVIVTLISVRMYVVDNGLTTSKLGVWRRVFWWMMIIFQLAPVLRYVDSFTYAMKSRRAEKNHDNVKKRMYYLKMLNEDSDVALLRVFGCYLESAPQQILQISILLLDANQGTTFYLIQQCCSIGSGFVSMAWSIVGYHRAIRFDQEAKANLTIPGTLFQFLWHLNVTVSRILSVSMVASLSPLWTSVSVMIHWIIVTGWLAAMDQPPFFGTSCLRLLLPAIFGLVYIFNFINTREGPTRYSYLFFYTLCAAENLAAIIVWALLTEEKQKLSWHYLVLIIVPTVTFVLAMVCLLLYYLCFHPKMSDRGTRKQPEPLACTLNS